MTYYAGKELADAFRTVRNNTLKIAEEISEANYGFRATPDTRTVAETLIHIALTTGLTYQVHGVEKLTSLAGFDFPAYFASMIADAKKPRTKDQIVALLRQEGDRIANWLGGLSEDFLAQRVGLPPGMMQESKSRFEMLLGMKEHEMHHRGQLMVLQRMLGMVPHLTREMNARIEAMMAARAAVTASA